MASPRSPKGGLKDRTAINRAIRAKLNFGHKLTKSECDYIRRHRDVFPVKVYSEAFLARVCGPPPAGGRRMTEGEILAMGKRMTTATRRGQPGFDLTPFVLSRALGPYKVW